jgi:signal peptidase I
MSRPQPAFTNRTALAEASRLPGKFHTAVVLSYFDELSLEEIAQIEGCPVGTIKSRVFRGKQILKQILEGERVPFFALALSFLLIGMGQVYNGKLRRGLLFFSASCIIPFLLIQLSVLGPGQTVMFLLSLSLAISLGLFVWAALDAWRQAKRTAKSYKLKAYNRLFVYIVLIVALNLLTYGPFVDSRKMEFLAAPYRTATASMAPTLLPKDLIMTDERIDHSSENSGLKRGELVIFKYPRDKKVRFIKRVIGLPGDEIELRGVDLYVNGAKWTA